LDEIPLASLFFHTGPHGGASLKNLEGCKLQPRR